MMERATIDYGIDLGTTNSAIAVLDGTEPRVITNQHGATFTPSAVWIDKRGRLHVGDEARQRREEDEQNCDIEFKLRMGLGERGKKLFARSGQEMLPEELSAEILKALRADVLSSMGDDIRAAVVTVPAAFDLPQCDATRRAAELAGLTHSPLLQEPVAAALAYGFQQTSDKVFWLVYDFGGGTFDAAVMQVRDGVIQVVNHAGDNHLGGKLIDWDIVEKRLVPALTGKFSLSGFQRGNRKWGAAFAKLKLAAEQAKIEVCRKQGPGEMWIENLCDDDAGNAVDFEYELTPAELDEIVAPYVTRSLNLCRKALAEKGLSGGNMEKVLMIGGTTLIPWLRDRVRQEVGAPLAFSIDPITVVARGAAVFAGTQRLPVDEGAPVPAGSFRIDLEYEPVGNELEPPVGGRISHPGGQSLDDYTIEIVETRSQWRSGKLRLGADGTFMADVHAERGRKCEFVLELCDAAGTRQSTVPDRFPYTVGMVITSPPLIHSVGVAMANNQMDPFMKKGTPLPARERSIHRTAQAVRADQAGTGVRIPVVEGENFMRADRNRLIGAIEVPAQRIRRDLPAGSEVEITIAIDESRLVTTKAYIPVLDEEFEEVLKLEKDPPGPSELRESLDREKNRLAESREKAQRTRDLKGQEALARIDREQMVTQTESLLGAAEHDPDAMLACENRLLDLKASIDDVEDALEWPTLVEDAEKELSDTRDIIDEHGTSEDRARLRTLECDLRSAIDSGDPDMLRQQTDEVNTHGVQVLLRQPGFWVAYLEHIEERKSRMRDSAQAEQLFAQGRRAINNNDVDSLKAVVRQLIALLPSEEQQEVRGFGGTTIR